MAHNMHPDSPNHDADAQEKKAQLRQAALEYHQFPTPGKISVTPTKQLINQHDLAPTARPCWAWAILARSLLSR